MTNFTAHQLLCGTNLEAYVQIHYCLGYSLFDTSSSVSRNQFAPGICVSSIAQKPGLRTLINLHFEDALHCRPFE